MKMHYNSSLWDKGKGHRGLRQRVDWKFEYSGKKRFIPAIYRFPKGIVFDIITLLDEAKLLEFFEEYEMSEESLAPLQRSCAKQNHPYQAVPIKEIWIDGKPVEGGYSSNSAVSIPWELQKDNLVLVRKAYPSILKGTSCFACERFCVPYPVTESKIQKLLRFLRINKVRSIKLSTRLVHWLFPLDIHFDMPAGENQKVVIFKHPVTKIQHTIYFQKAKLVEIPLGTDRNRSLYTAQAMYEIEPALPEGDALQFKSSIQYTQPSDNKFKPTAASSVGIIGGADGPTAVFISAAGGKKNIPRGLHGLTLHNCFSAPSFNEDDALRFILEGINIKKDDGKEYVFH